MTEYEKQMEKTDDPNPKTPYSRPQLEVYGDIWEITLASEKGEKTDGPGQERNRTGFSTPRPSPSPNPTQG